MNEPNPVPVKQWLRILLWIGFISSCFLLGILTLGLATNRSGSDLLFYVLIPVVLPVPVGLLLLLFYTRVPFEYSERKRDKIVREFQRDIFGNLFTEEDISWVLRDQAKKWHPDGIDTERQQFFNDVLSRIVTILNELKKEVRQTGTIDWSTKKWDV